MTVATPGTNPTINCALKGAGPPLLLHGYPQNHLIWPPSWPGITRSCWPTCAAMVTPASLPPTPTRHVLRNVTRAMATEYYHWSFLSTGTGIA